MRKPIASSSSATRVSSPPAAARPFPPAAAFLPRRSDALPLVPDAESQFRPQANLFLRKQAGIGLRLAQFGFSLRDMLTLFYLQLAQGLNIGVGWLLRFTSERSFSLSVSTDCLKLRQQSFFLLGTS